MLPEIDCACASVRRTARLITQLYSHEMGGQIEPGQFSLLMAIDEHPGCNQSVLGQALGFDKTTLSRNFQILRRNGWIERATPITGFRLTAAGAKLLAETKPGWKRAQQKLRKALKTDWTTTLQLLHDAAEAAITARK